MFSPFLRAQVTAEYETKSLTDILASPISALEGVGEVLSTMLGELNVKTVGDLAVFKYCQWAEAIVTLATLEHSKSKKERTAENMLKKLA